MRNLIQSQRYLLGQVGQAVIEYLVVFAFMTLFSLALLKNFSGFMSTTFGNLAFVLQQHLTVGVCEKACFAKNYGN